MIFQLFYGEFAAIITNLAFAFGFVLARKIDKEATPIFQNAIRAIVAAITFTLITLFFGVFIYIFSLPWNLILILAISIFFMVILGDTAYLQSQKFIGPAKALAITTTSPFFTILFGVLFLDRPFSISMIISGILIAIGVILITIKKIDSNYINNEDKPNNTNELNTNDTIINSKIKISIIGTFWAFFTAIAWAIGFALSDYSFNEINTILDIGLLSTILGLVVRYIFACSVLIVLAIVEEKRKPFQRSRNTWIILFLAAFISNSVGGLFFAEAVRTAGAPFISLMTTAMPLFTIPFSYFINKEKISKIAFLGIIITLVGVVLLIF